MQDDQQNQAQVSVDGAVPVVNQPTVQTSSPVPQPAEATPPETGINGVTMENAYIEPGPQIGAAKATEPDSVPTAASMISTNTQAAAPPAVDADLATIKQQALQSLEPLVDKLEMAPEEKFKTVMMIIQASDKQEMLEKAFEAANQITDDKTKAKALLDVVNEVNYFAQKNQPNQT